MPQCFDMVLGFAAMSRRPGLGVYEQPPLAQADPTHATSVVDWDINRLCWTVERTLEGQAIDEATITAAVERAGDGVDALLDLHASGDYRLALAQVQTKRALLRTSKRAQGRGAVKVSGSYTVNAPRERLWEALNDPAFLKTCLPGCESLETSGPDQYQAILTVGIAVVKGKYTGSVTLSEKEPPQRFKMQVDGKGTGGFMQGAGLLEFADDPQGTKVTYQGDVQVGGPIASIGQRLLDGAAKMIVGHFFTAVNTQLAGTSEPPTPPPTS